MYSYHTRPPGGGWWIGPLIRGLAAAAAVVDQTWSLPCDGVLAPKAGPTADNCGCVRNDIQRKNKVKFP